MGVGRSANSNVVLTDFAVFIAPPAADSDTEIEAQAEESETPINTDAKTETENEPTVDAGSEVEAENTPASEADVESETADVDPEDPWTRIPVVQAWADHEQALGEDGLEGVVANAIDNKPETGWALDRRIENRQAIFLVAAPFGMEGGRLKIRLKHEYDLRQKQLGRFRLALTDAPTIYPIGSKITLGDWHAAGPFTAEHGNLAFYQVYEPETKNVNTNDTFEVNGKTLKWEKQAHWVDGTGPQRHCW